MRGSRVIRWLGWVVAICAVPILLLVVWKYGGARPGAATQPIADASPYPWRVRFEKLYRLEPGEIVRLISPPFAAERRQFITLDWRDSRAIVDGWQMTFYYDEARGLGRNSFAAHPGTLGSGVAASSELTRAEVEMADELKFLEVAGDWIVRRNSTLEQRMAAVGQILSSATGRRIAVRKTTRQRRVLVVSGTYAFTPLPQAKDPRTIHLYCRELIEPNGAGGGSGPLSSILHRLEEVTGQKIVNQAVVAGGTKVGWTNHHDLSSAGKDLKMRELLLDNVRKQTGLTFSAQTQDVEIWTVEEQK
jgi:hypothetical protein